MNVQGDEDQNDTVLFSGIYQLNKEGHMPGLFGSAELSEELSVDKVACDRYRNYSRILWELFWLRFVIGAIIAICQEFTDERMVRQQCHTVDIDFGHGILFG